MDKAVSDLWWKNAVVYCLDVETYVDASGDGVGDFRGLTRRLQYIAGLGVTCIWLMPFYPSPNRDDGYDVSDYYNVDPRYGTLGDFVEFVRTANDRGIRVIIDLVVNHTSVEHPWFQESRDPQSDRHGWYVWSDQPLDRPEQVIFPEAEDSNWERDERSGKYYLHRFYTEEPDLNVANPQVRDEIHRIIGFWMQMGVSGFRVDAVPYLIGEAGIWDEMPDQPHSVLREMRKFMGRRRGDAVMIGEVNLDYGERTKFFGHYGEEMTGLFNFMLAGAVFNALATEDARSLAGHLRDTPPSPEECQWMNFLRNHDELNVGHLPREERETVLSALATERTRIFGRGIRRRVPPLVGGDPRQIRLLYSVMLALPGTPVLLYGEEIGMGDDLSLQGRMAVRTPMQWSSGANAGFSTAAAPDLVRPVVTDGQFGYEEVNVAKQRRDPDSLLNWMERALRTRKECPEFGWGRWEVLGTDVPAVLAHRCDWLDSTVIAVHNFSGEPANVRLDVGEGNKGDQVMDVFGDREYDPLNPGDPRLQIAGYGYRWMRPQGPGGSGPAS
ncbi:MAG TPA: alpha-amylase family protein [Acidimicrobiales bacterium]|nr:alpha-amylase family protein [Acidimicrobiales bacterium]